MGTKSVKNETRISEYINGKTHTLVGVCVSMISREGEEETRVYPCSPKLRIKILTKSYIETEFVFLSSWGSFRYVEIPCLMIFRNWVKWVFTNLMSN